jgi:hypothetical protein
MTSFICEQTPESKALAMAASCRAAREQGQIAIQFPFRVLDPEGETAMLQAHAS